MTNKPLTSTEMKHLKFLMMKRGYSEEQCSRELSNLIEVAKKNHKTAMRKRQEERREFKEEFNKLKSEKNATS